MSLRASVPAVILAMGIAVFSAIVWLHLVQAERGVLQTARKQILTDGSKLASELRAALRRNDLVAARGKVMRASIDRRVSAAILMDEDARIRYAMDLRDLGRPAVDTGLVYGYELIRRVRFERTPAEHVFEPFFSTKEIGKGTGLGLSMVYGFIKQSKGHVSILDTESEGTAVAIYLPRAPAGRTPATRASREAGRIEGEGKTILLVEDDDEVRCVTRNMLHDLN